jgi:undecaprenyl-diphosphatase
MAIDLKIFYFFNNLAGKWPVFDFFVLLFAEYFQYFLGVVFAILLVFFQYENKKKWRIFFVTLVSIIFSRLVFTNLIRVFYHRPRPFLVLSVNQLTTDSSYSFPSGHAAFFFAMAMAIYLYNKKWGIWFFVSAFVVSLARVLAGVHYPSDLIGGAVVGIATACLVFWANKKIESR